MMSDSAMVKTMWDEPDDTQYQLDGVFPIKEQEFNAIRDFIYEHLGIALCPAKKSMVAGRLRSRLKHYNLHSYGEYFRLVKKNLLPGEVQEMFDCLTTNETFFFREAAHFDYLREFVLPNLSGNNLRVWSAASSSGEEVYSLAMELARQFHQLHWELLGSDINSQVLRKAQQGHYPMLRHEGIPQNYLSRYCLRGTGRYEGTFLIKKELRERVQFRLINLKEPLPKIGKFDVIFLRNVLIYFDAGTKLDIVRRVINQLKPGGYLFISHTENLHGLEEGAGLTMVRPSVYRMSAGRHAG